MYIEQAYKGLTDAWRYIVGILIIFVAWQILGSFPLIAGLLLSVDGFENFPSDISGMVALLGNNLFLFLMLISFAIGLAGLFISSKYLHNLSLKNLTTTRTKIDWKRFWFIFILWGATTSTLVIIDYLYIAPENYRWNFQLQPFLILLALGLFLLPLQTSFEEYLFRGYGMHAISIFTTSRKFPILFIYIFLAVGTYALLNKYYPLTFLYKFIILLVLIVVFIILLTLKKDLYNNPNLDGIYAFFKRKYTPLIITSVTFGLMHILNPEVATLGPIIMVYYIGTGLFLGIITLMDDGLELALGFHFANNLFTALLVTADWTALQTNSVLIDISDPKEMVISEIIVPVLIIFPILLFILAKKYKWSNWKEKLFGPVIAPEKEDYKILE